MSQARYDPQSVRKLFDEMAATYGRINLISSFGFTARWRHQCTENLPLDRAQCVFDLMSGMGELWRSLARGLSPSATVIGVDISAEMTKRSSRERGFRVLVQDVLDGDVPDGVADVVVCSFGLKTFDCEQQRSLARIVQRLLKPGGTYSFVEISVPRFGPLRFLFMFYLKYMIPWIGRLLLGDPQCYRMLGAYTEAFGSASYFGSCLNEAGLETESVRYFFGCATGVRGVKPA